MKVSWSKALSVWWSMAWRGLIYSVLASFVLGAIGGVIAVVIHSPEKARVYGEIGGYIGSIPASMLALKQTLSKHLASLTAIATNRNA